MNHSGEQLERAIGSRAVATQPTWEHCDPLHTEDPCRAEQSPTQPRVADLNALLLWLKPERLLEIGSRSQPSLLFRPDSDSELVENETIDACGREHALFDLLLLHREGSVAQICSELERAQALLKPNGCIAINDRTDRRWSLTAKKAVREFLVRRSGWVQRPVAPDPSQDTGLVVLFRRPTDGNLYDLDTHYDPDFYERCESMHAQVVPPITELLVERFHPRSVIDFGCGAGMWLRAFRDAGVEEIAGVDGSREAVCNRNSDLSEFVELADLRQSFRPKRRFDLCLCLDVIEHIEPEFESNLVRSLVSAADEIIFSTPPPGQGGDGHVNERPIAHWAELFMQHGYLLTDELRPALCALPGLPETTYQLNTFVARKLLSADRPVAPAYATSLKAKEARIEDLFMENRTLRAALVAHEGQEVGSELERLFQSANPLALPMPTDQIKQETEHCFTFELRTAVGKAFGLTQQHADSTLFEDGHPLPFANCPHEEIRNIGEGRFSMWRGKVYFSTTDGTDPRSNGRTYCFIVPPAVYLLETLPTTDIEKMAL